MASATVNACPASASNRDGIEQRVARERDFHDRIFAKRMREPVEKFYAISGSAFAYYQERLPDGVRDHDFHEYGCGPGSAAFIAVAAAGACALAIDISLVAWGRQ